MKEPRQAQDALPSIVHVQLQKLGRDIAIARKRRRLSMRNMAERMMVGLETVQRLEKGDPSVGIGKIAAALWILGLHRRIGELVSPENDPIGLQEDIKRMPRDFREHKKKREDYDF